MGKPKPFGIDNVRVRVERGPREDGRWYWRADQHVAGGRREKVWFGWATRAEADREVRNALASAGVEPEPAPAEDEVTRLETVRDLLECWIQAHDERADLSERTHLAANGSSKRLVSKIGDIRIEELNRRALEQFRDQSLREDCAGSTIQRDLKTLRQAWRWGREVGQVPTDRDLPSVRVLRVQRVYTDFTPTRAQILQVVVHARPAWIRRALILLWATGARIGEIVTLKWTAVHDERIVVSGKTGSREVPVHADVMAQVRSWRTEGQPPRTGREIGVKGAMVLLRASRPTIYRWVAEGEFEPTHHNPMLFDRDALIAWAHEHDISPDPAGFRVPVPERRSDLEALVLGVSPDAAKTAIQVELARLSEALKLPGRLSPHGFRRAAVDALYRTGIPPEVAADLLGHSPATALAHYRQVSREDREAAITKARLGLPPLEEE